MILWPCNSAFAQISVSKIFAPKLSLIHSIRLQVGERVAAAAETKQIFIALVVVKTQIQATHMP